LEQPIYNALQCKLNLDDVRAHYNSYLAAGHISVYNPVSIMSAFQRSMIENFWVATGFLVMIIFFFSQLSNAIGQFPLLNRNFPKDGSMLEAIETLMSKPDAEITFQLQDSVICSMCPSSLPV
jgi:hypothetical protein